MSKRGFAALVGALVLTLAVMIGAWSYSMATVTGSGILRIASSPEALVGIDYLTSQELIRTQTVVFDVPVDSRTANPVNMYVQASSVPSGLTVTAWPEAPGEFVSGGGSLDCTVSVTADAGAALGPTLAKVKVYAEGQGFRALIDLDVPVYVVNAPPTADDGTLEVTLETEGDGDHKVLVDTQGTIELSALAADPDGTITRYTVSYAGSKGSVSRSGSIVTYTALASEWTADGVDSFAYTVTDADGDTAAGTITVIVTVPTTP